MTVCSPGAIVLVRFPFTDLSATKKRPAIVLSSEEHTRRSGDVVLVPLTGVPQSDASRSLSRWHEAGLLKPTWIKPMIATVSQSLIDRELGRLHEDDWARLMDAMRALLAPRLFER